MRFALKTAAVTSYFCHIDLYFDSEVQITPMKYLIMFRNINYKYFGSSNVIIVLIEVKVQSIHYCQKHPWYHLYIRVLWYSLVGHNFWPRRPIWTFQKPKSIVICSIQLVWHSLGQPNTHISLKWPMKYTQAHSNFNQALLPLAILFWIVTISAVGHITCYQWHHIINIVLYIVCKWKRCTWILLSVVSQLYALCLENSSCH